MPVKTKQGRTLSRTDALQNRFVAQLELAAADNELELVVDAIRRLLLQRRDEHHLHTESGIEKTLKAVLLTALLAAADMTRFR